MASPAYVTNLITDELNRNKTNPGWRGHGIVVRRNQFSLIPDLREQIQEIGRIHGCHTGLCHVNIDQDQPWVGGYVPPTKLTARDRAKVMGPCWRGKTYLYPQCHECSHKQSAIVDALKRSRKRFETLKTKREGTDCSRSRRRSGLYQIVGSQGKSGRRAGNSGPRCERGLPLLRYLIP